MFRGLFTAGVVMCLLWLFACLSPGIAKVDAFIPQDFTTCMGLMLGVLKKYPIALIIIVLIITSGVLLADSTKEEEKQVKIHSS